MSQPPEDGAPPAYEPFAPPSPPAEQPPPFPGAPPGYGQYPAYGQYPGYGYAAGYPTEPERAPGTDGFAVATLVLGILSAIPLAVIFGIVALRRIARSHQGGKGLAIAGLVISFGWALVIVAVIALASLGRVTRGHDGPITTAGRVAAADLRVGDCIQLPKNPTTVVAFDAVPCSTPHDAEAYASGTLPLTGDWPGDDPVAQATDQRCADAFEPFVGVSIDDSVLEVSYFYPEQDAWENGDRGYVCVIGSDVTQTTGTLKGANR